MSPDLSLNPNTTLEKACVYKRSEARCKSFIADLSAELVVGVILSSQI